MDKDVFRLLQLRNYLSQEVLVDAKNMLLDELVVAFQSAMLQGNEGHLVPVFVLDYEHFLQNVYQELAQFCLHLLRQAVTRTPHTTHFLL